MPNQLFSISELLQRYRDGEDLYALVPAKVAAQIEEIAGLEALDAFEAQMQVLVEGLDTTSHAPKPSAEEQEKEIEKHFRL
ncbi:MAG: hypothetical protein HC913_23320 [Microscillaceae bacterium]|nr:hypothetical protein [Microscillaceae bacterium]